MKSLAVALASLAAMTGSCLPGDPPQPPPSFVEAEVPAARRAVTPPGPVVLVTIDGARWQEVFEGTDPMRVTVPGAHRGAAELMPTLHALGSDRGAFVGAPGGPAIRASGPNFVSLPGYLEILTGRPSTECADNECPQTRTRTLLDAAAASGRSVAAFASWERLGLAVTAEPGTFLVSAGRPTGDATAPWPGSGAYRPDARTAGLALEHLERAQPDVLFLGLGDPDEHAHHGDYEGYVRSLEQADRILARLLDVLDRMGDRGRATHVFVTADHGRALDFRSHGGFAPESSRVWLVGVGPKIRARGASRSPRERRLADVAPTIAAVAGIEPPRGDRQGEVMRELVDPVRSSPSTTSL